MKPALLLAVASLGLAKLSLAATATIYNDDLPHGTASFDAAVASTGSQLRLQPMWFMEDGGRVFNFTDFTISATDGTRRLVDDDYADLRQRKALGALSGWALGIVPNASVAGSGLTFDFRHPINAFGIEIGDWATCCFASSLYIAFDGGATRLVATARTSGDNPGLLSYGQYTNFVGAIDTSGTFSRVTLYGDGVGEYLVAGGTIRYAGLPLGSVGVVPEPATAAMLLAGLLGMLQLSQRRGAARITRWNGLQRLE